MADGTRDKWDDRWAQRAARPFVPSPLLAGHGDWFSGGLALDLACGRGQNSLWLAERAYRVLAVDLSAVALAAGHAEAVRRGLAGRMAFVQIDLDHWTIPPAAFDVIAVLQFREQRLYQELRAGVRPGGLLVLSTHNLGYLEREPTANPAYLVQPGEWPAAFGDWELLYHEEGPTQTEMIARRPGPPPID